MRWYEKILKIVPEEERDGIRLNTAEPFWEVEGPDTFQELFINLKGIFPEKAILYFEGGNLDDELKTFMARYAVPEGTHVALGTIWPRPAVYHVPAKESIFDKLASIMEHHAEPELAIHFHVYHGETVLLEWHDAFDDYPMLISGEVPEEKIRLLADRMGKEIRYIVVSRK